MFNIVQAYLFAQAIKERRYRPGTFYFLESPITGNIGATKSVLKFIRKAGFDLVYFRGDWWEFYQ
jgi:hypothetical protein